MIKVLVTGSKGQLGNEVRLLSESKADWKFIFTDVEELDITNPQAIGEFFAEHKPDVLINGAGYTAVDKAEEQEKMAELINAAAVRFLGEQCSKNNTFMVHVSTDFVFDGQKNTPYSEGDFPGPLSNYAKTKFHGEQACLDSVEKGVIMRTSWLYSTFGHNFVKTMMRLGAEKEELGVVYDQIGAPTYARDLAAAIFEMIENRQKVRQCEIFHYSNEGVASWYDFAVSVMEYAELNCDVKPLITSEYPLPARRPHYSLMSKKKLRDFLGIKIPHWRTSLKECVLKLKNQSK